MQQLLNIGDIVVSIAGHDESKYAIVISVINEQFVLIADGKLRTVAKPKLKKVKHLRKIVGADNVCNNEESVKFCDDDIMQKIEKAI